MTASGERIGLDRPRQRASFLNAYYVPIWRGLVVHKLWSFPGFIGSDLIGPLHNVGKAEGWEKATSVN